MKFKVGDKVRVREDLVEGNLYGTEYFIGLMKYYRGKVFEITKVWATSYKLGGDGLRWTDEMLEEVKKEVQEKTFREVIADIKEGEIWVNVIAPISYIRLRENGVLDFNENKGVNLNCKYTLQRKTYTFAEAFKAYEEGKEIESCHSQYKFKRDGEKDLFFDKECRGVWCEADCFFDITEIRGKWYINN